MPTRGVQKDPKPKTRTENPIPEPIFRVPEPKYLVFSVRVPEPIILSGYWFGYGSGSTPKRVADNPNFFLEFFDFVSWASGWSLSVFGLTAEHSITHEHY